MRYENPIVSGFYPDPSICHVGEDYYLVMSSFEYFPGIPIFHSRDLVNWEQLGNCIQRAEEFPLAQVGDSGGVWAPTIRYHEGSFYVTATLSEHGNFIISAKDPAGEWSAPVWVEFGGIDPSLYFENGKAYYCTNQTLHEGIEEITLAELDVQTGKKLSEQRTVWNGIGGGYLEAPHVYKIGGWYYMMGAEGGTNFNHMVTIARSKEIWGPYENCPHNPILTNVHDTTKQVQCAGHGDLFEDHNGNWWMVHLGTRLSRRTMTHLGRETFLTLIVWEEGWPVVKENRMARISCEGPLWAKQKPSEPWKADFTKKDWEPQWIFVRNPISDNYERGNGALILHPSEITLSDAKNPTFAAVRQPDFDATLQTTFTFDAKQDGDEAGVAILVNREFHYRFCVRRQGEKLLLVLDKTAEDMCQTVVICELAQPAEKIALRVLADKEKYHFYYKISDGEEVYAASASTRFLACEVAGRTFTGTVWGVYASCIEKTESVMGITEFRCQKN